MSGGITIRKIKNLKAKSNTNANAKAKASRSRARRGDFNIMWLIVAIIGVVIGVIIFYFVYAGGMRSMGATTAPIITAQAASGLLTVNIKVSGVGSVDINAINLYSGTTAASCSSVTYYLNGQSYRPPSSGPLITLKPGQTFTAVYSSCTPPVDQITTVQVVTSAGTYTAPVT